MTDLSDEDRAHARKQFDFFDEDGNGFIDFDEFADLLKVIAGDVNARQIGRGFSMVDTDSDGQVSFDEFMTWWETAWYEF